jgi:hypothetical protein
MYMPKVAVEDSLIYLRALKPHYIRLANMGGKRAMRISAIFTRDVCHVRVPRWFSIFVLGTVIIGATITAAFAEDECSGVSNCLSTPDTQLRTVPPDATLNFDVSCSQDSDAPYMWNWHVVQNDGQATRGDMSRRHHKPDRSSQTIDISLVKLQKDASGNEIGVRLRIDNRAENQPAVLSIKLGCSANPFPYYNAVRKGRLTIRPSN